MKNVLPVILISVFLCSCSSEKNNQVEPDQIQPENQSVLVSENLILYQNGLYYDEPLTSAFCYADNLEKVIKVADLSYNDDQPSAQKTNYDQYSDTYNGSSIYVYDHRLFYLADYAAVDGQTACRLYALSADGTQRQMIREFDFKANSFLIQNNKLIVTEITGDQSSCLHIFDVNGEEITRIEEDGIVCNLFADEDNVYFQISRDQRDSQIDVIRTETLDVREVLNGETVSFLYESAGKMAVRRLNHKVYSSEDLNDLIMDYEIIDCETGESVLHLTDEAICCFDEQFVYTCSYEEGNAVYRLRDWKGNAVEEVIPSDSLGTPGIYSTFTGSADYSPIGRVTDHKLIAVTYDKNSFKKMIVVCDIAEQSDGCRIVSDELN